MSAHSSPTHSHINTHTQLQAGSVFLNRWGENLRKRPPGIPCRRSRGRASTQEMMSDNKQTNKRSHLLFLSLFFCHLSENGNKQPVHLPPRSFSRLIYLFIFFYLALDSFSAVVCAFVREHVRVTNVPSRYRKFSRQLKSLTLRSPSSPPPPPPASLPRPPPPLLLPYWLDAHPHKLVSLSFVFLRQFGIRTRSLQISGDRPQALALIVTLCVVCMCLCPAGSRRINSSVLQSGERRSHGEETAQSGPVGAGGRARRYARQTSGGTH